MASPARREIESDSRTMNVVGIYRNMYGKFPAAAPTARLIKNKTHEKPSIESRISVSFARITDWMSLLARKI